MTAVDDIVYFNRLADAEQLLEGILRFDERTASSDEMKTASNLAQKLGICFADIDPAWTPDELLNYAAAAS